VWAWLPGAAEPVVAGRIDADGPVHTFTYGRSYLERPDAISLYLPELPLRRGTQRPVADLDIAGCLADAGPDSWGQRVILARHLGHLGDRSDTGELSRLTYLLESGSDRIGALDFQTSATRYEPRTGQGASLEDLQNAADAIQAGQALPPSLADALVRGTSIGGARPKVLLADGDRRLIAKFSSTTDPYPVVKAEAVAMDLARRVGLKVPWTDVGTVAGRDVLLVERFDRPAGGARRLMVSALTMLELSELTARYASYADLADLVRARFTEPGATLRELFTRIVFNIAVGNIDDHARNHAAFWNGSELTLTPAYDLCPQVRSGDESAQAMAIDRDGARAARFAVCHKAAPVYLLSAAEASSITEHVVTTIREQWHEAADAARLTDLERARLWGRQILNPSVFYI
jgi:serine/threonine-protein kinase HipA